MSESDTTRPDPKSTSLASQLSRLTWLPGGLWLAGSLVSLIVLTRQMARQRRVRREAATAASWLVNLVQQVSRKMRLRPVRTAVSAQIVSPMICCLGAPRLLWPNSRDDAASSPASEGVVAHELAHVARRDHYVAWFEMAVSVGLWWHPLAWWLRRRLRESRELACDALAVSVISDRQAYANLLLQLSSASNDQWVAASALGVGDASRKSLERRLTMIFNERASGRVSLSGMVVLGLLAVLCVPGWSLSDDPKAAVPWLKGEVVAPVAPTAEPKADPVAPAAPVNSTIQIFREGAVVVLTDVTEAVPQVKSESDKLAPDLVRGVRFINANTVVVPDGGQVTVGGLAQSVDDHGTWQSQEMDLGKSGYVAFVGPWGKNQPLEYTVAVGKKNPDGSLSTVAAAKLSLAGMPEGFAQRPIKDVVKFDPAAQQQVTFNLGGQEMRFQLPSQVAAHGVRLEELPTDLNVIVGGVVDKNHQPAVSVTNGSAAEYRIHVIPVLAGGSVVTDLNSDGQTESLEVYKLGRVLVPMTSVPARPDPNSPQQKVNVNDYHVTANTLVPAGATHQARWVYEYKQKAEADRARIEAEAAAMKQAVDQAEKLFKEGTGTAAQVEEAKAKLAAAQQAFDLLARESLRAFKDQENATTAQPDLQRELLTTDVEEAEANLEEKRFERDRAVELVASGNPVFSKMRVPELAVKKAEIELRRSQLRLKIHDRTQEQSASNLPQPTSLNLPQSGPLPLAFDFQLPLVNGLGQPQPPGLEVH